LNRKYRETTLGGKFTGILPITMPVYGWQLLFDVMFQKPYETSGRKTRPMTDMDGFSCLV